MILNSNCINVLFYSNIGIKWFIAWIIVYKTSIYARWIWKKTQKLLIRDAKVYVDLADACLNESGDFIKAREAGIISENPIVGEIGDYCLNKLPGRESEEEITIFKSVGVAIQDYAVATDIYNFSLIKGFGQEINLFE